MKLIKMSFLFFVFALLFLSVFSSNINASLLVVDEKGEIVWNVLSEDDDLLALEVTKRSQIEVKKAAEEKTDASSVISLEKNDGRVSLVVTSDTGTRELDVSDMSGELVRVEERAQVQEIALGVVGDKFSLKQKGISALTNFPIKVDAQRAEFSVRTSSGDKFISILPFQAVEILLRSKLLNRIENNEIEIIEEGQELQYLVVGERLLNVLDIFEYSVPVTTKLSASTGEILSIEAPIWYKVVAYFLT
ncbi:hypothetical protein KKB40_06240 [Patescibacteria group bacterium]|nr:hypothetical protein [Patescibacteria group bacterium]